MSRILYISLMKTVIFLGDSRERIRDFPEDARYARAVSFYVYSKGLNRWIGNP
jgi:predicted dinucleotide-utilizing enzyme